MNARRLLVVVYLGFGLAAVLNPRGLVEGAARVAPESTLVRSAVEPTRELSATIGYERVRAAVHGALGRDDLGELATPDAPASAALWEDDVGAGPSPRQEGGAASAPSPEPADRAEPLRSAAPLAPSTPAAQPEPAPRRGAVSAAGRTVTHRRYLAPLPGPPSSPEEMPVWLVTLLVDARGAPVDTGDTGDSGHVDGLGVDGSGTSDPGQHGALESEPDDPDGEAELSEFGDAPIDNTAGAGGRAGPGAVPPLRAASSTDPLRLWVIGDSMLNMAGPHLKTFIEETGRATVRVGFKSSTGLVRDDYFDWPSHAAASLRTHGRPDAVLIMMGANDSQSMVIDGVRLERWSPLWQAEYRQRVAELMDVFVAEGVRVYWAGLPLMASSLPTQTQSAINPLIREEAEARAGAHYIDTTVWFENPEGGYARWLIGRDGRKFDARAKDGVHFTDAGAQHLARLFIERLDQDWAVNGPPRREDGSLVSIAREVRIRRDEVATTYAPLTMDPSARFPTLYLMAGESWGDGWPEHADALLGRLSRHYGVILVAAETDQLDLWLREDRAPAIERDLPTLRRPRGVAAVSTAAMGAWYLADNARRSVQTASRTRGVLDNVRPPWLGEDVDTSLLGKTEPPRIHVRWGEGEPWDEPAGRTFEERIEAHVALHVYAWMSTGAL